MNKPSQLLNPNGTREAKMKWTITCPQEYALASKISRFAKSCHLDLISISSQDVGFLKLNEEIRFQVFGTEPNLFVFFDTIEHTINKLNTQIDKELESAKKLETSKKSLLKRIFSK